MVGLPRIRSTFAFQLAVATAAVLVPASASPRAARDLCARNRAESSSVRTVLVPPPAQVQVIEPLPQWHGPTAVATMPLPGYPETVATGSANDAVVVPEPSVMVLLLGGVGIALLPRRPHRRF
jgi:hypothetical protein